MEREVVKTVEILLIEDSEADSDLIKEAIKHEKLLINLHITRDGEEALEFLRRQGCYANAMRPDLILLDLNLPKKDGREVLQEVKDDADLRLIPVVVLTSSTAEEDVFKSYQLHANCYVKKPVDFDLFKKIVQQIAEFWFSVVILPRK